MFNSLNKFLYNINKLIASGDVGTNSAVDPIYEFLTTFGPLMIGLLSGVAVIYCVVLGIQYAKAEESKDREIAKKKLISAAISFGVIILLIVILYALRGTLVQLMNDTN